MALAIYVARPETPCSTAIVIRGPCARELHEATASVINCPTFPRAAKVRSCFWRAAHVAVADVIAVRARATEGTECDVPAATIAAPAALIVRIEGHWVTCTLVVIAFIPFIWAREQVNLAQTIISDLAANFPLS